MKKSLLISLAVVLFLAVAAVALSVLYKVFVTDKIMDRGDSVNREPWLLLPAEGAELCAVSYARGGDMEPENNFRYSLTVENGRALLSCDAFTDSGEPLQLEDVPVDMSRVAALEKTLRSMELAEYPAGTENPGGSVEETTDEGSVSVYLEWTDGTRGCPDTAGEEIYGFFKDLLWTIQ